MPQAQGAHGRRAQEARAERRRKSHHQVLILQQAPPSRQRLITKLELLRDKLSPCYWG